MANRSSPVAILSEGIASRLGGAEAVLRRHLILGEGTSEQSVTIVGVVRDSKMAMSGAPGPTRPAIYRPFDQAPEPQLATMLRTDRERSVVAGSLLPALHELGGAPPDRDDIQWLANVVSSQLDQQRFNRASLSLLAALTLGLALVGLFGAITYVALSRKHEVAIRLVLGAKPGMIALSMASDGLGLTLAGTIAGSFMTFVLGPLFAAKLKY